MTAPHPIPADPLKGHDRLLDAVFYDGAPIWRRPFAAHVKAWQRHIQRESWRLFHTNAAFRDAYHARGGLFSPPMVAGAGR